MTRVGAIFSPYLSAPETQLAVARTADEAGLAELWLWEDCFRQSGFAAAAAALAATERLRVGPGISPMPLRTAAITAMEIATIERMFPGRFLPGLGHGVQDWMRQVDVRVASPLTLMREYVPAVRALLAGDEVTVAGRYVALDRVRLDWPPARAPRVYAAAEGPKTLALCGEVADGVVLDNRRTPEDIGAQVAAVRAGRAAAGRDGDHDVIAYVTGSFGAGALDRAVAIFGDERPADAEQRVAAGDVEEVAAVVRRFGAAGADSVALVPPPGEDLDEFYRSAAEVGRLVAG